MDDESSYHKKRKRIRGRQWRPRLECDDETGVLTNLSQDIQRLEEENWEKLTKALAKCQPIGGSSHVECRFIIKKHGQEDVGIAFHILKGLLEEWCPVMCAKLESDNALVENEHLLCDDDVTAELCGYSDVIIDEFDRGTTEDFIYFLYHGKVYHGKVCGDSMMHLLELARMAKYYGLIELQKLCMYHLSFIMLDYDARLPMKIPTRDVFQSAGFELLDLLPLGCHPRMLVACGFELWEFIAVQATDRDLRRAAFSVTELMESGRCTPDMAVSIFRDDGYSCVEAIEKMIRLRFTATELNVSGWNRRRFELQMPYASAFLLIDSGYKRDALRMLGYHNETELAIINDCRRRLLAG